LPREKSRLKKRRTDLQYTEPLGQSGNVDPRSVWFSYALYVAEVPVFTMPVAA